MPETDSMQPIPPFGTDPAAAAAPAGPEIPEEASIVPSPGKSSHLFRPGCSGNPSGRPKRTKEEKDALEAVRNLAPMAAKKVKAMLESPKTPAVVKVKLIEIIFDRAFGKPESAVKVTSVQETVEESREYLLALVQHIREVDAQ